MARDAYKNLKIKFEGDDTDLSQAMRDVKKESNAAASELRDVEKALKLDPSNVELLAQKESYAAKEAEALKRRMDLVNAALADSSVERGSLAYDRLQRELVRTRSELSGMGGDAEKASRGLRDVAEQAQRAADRLDKVGNALSVGVTAPVTAGAAALVAFGVDADNSMATLEAAVGDGTEAAERLRRVGKDLWKRGWSDSMGELTPALVDSYEVLGDIGEEDMSAAVRGAKTMERVWGADVNESLRGVNVLMTRFGLSAQESTDLMVAGAQRGLNFTDELGDNLAEYAGRWGDAGVSASQYFSMLQAGVDAGAYSLDKVGDYLNEFLTSLSDGRLEEHIGNFSTGTQELFQQYKDGGATAKDVLDAVVGELKGCQSETEAATIASEIWSSLGEDNAMSVITALAGVSDSYADVAGSADGAASDIEDSIGNRATAAVNSLKDSLEPFADRAVDLLERVADTVEGVSAWFSSLDEGTQQLIVDGVALAATAGPLLKVGGSVVRGAGKLAGKLSGAGGAAKGLTAAAKGVTGASKASGIAMEAAGAASAGMASSMLGAVGGATAVVGTGIELSAAWQAAGRDFEGAAADFESATGRMGEAGKAVASMTEDVKAQYASLDQSTADSIAAMDTWAQGFRGASAWAFELFPQNKANFVNEYQQMFAQIDTDTVAGWLAVQAETASGGQALTAESRSTVEQICDTYETLSDFLPDESEQALRAMASAMEGSVPELRDAADMDCDEIISTIRRALLDGGSSTANLGSQAVTGMAGSISGGSGQVRSAASQVAGAAQEMGRDRWAASSWGSDMASNYAGGIWDGLGWVRDAANAIANAARSVLHFSEPDEGPLSDFSTYAPDMVDLFAGGMLKGVPKVRGAAEELARAADVRAVASFGLADSASSMAVPSASLSRRRQAARPSGRASGASATDELLRQILDAVERAAGAGVTVQIDGRAVARATAPAMDEEMARVARRRGAA